MGECKSLHWWRGYEYNLDDIPITDILIEYDEGWGAYMGSDFGCVHWEKK
jgi:hypothetical protein